MGDIWSEEFGIYRLLTKFMFSFCIYGVLIFNIKYDFIYISKLFTECEWKLEEREIAHPSKFKITIKDRPVFNAGTVQNPSYSRGECKSHSRTVQNFHSQTPLSRICSLHMMLKKIKGLLQYTHKLPINSASWHVLEIN